jgi:uncharacterized repeat protein (TIGR03803 family)
MRKFGAGFLASLILVSASVAAPQYRVLYAFTGGSDGGGVFAGVVFDKNGRLYGTTIGGGAYRYGTVFKLKRQPDGQWAEKVLHNFNNDPDGQQPVSGLIFDAAGHLYGTATLGGAQHGGTLFEMMPGPGGWTFNVAYTFCSQPSCSDGSGPQGGLALDAAGNLYGTAFNVFELTSEAGGWTESVLYNFCSKPDCIDGYIPYAGLTLDTKGNLFGTTNRGGTYKVGTVFKLRHMPDGTWKERVLHSFFSFPTDGQIPGVGQLVFDSSGNLYGTTVQGGSHGCGAVGCGTVFKLTPQPNGHWKEAILHNFRPGKSGYGPGAGVVFDRAGNLYGTTLYGGTECDCGVVYKLASKPDGTWTYTVLHRFTGHDGAQPGANLILDDQNRLYGTAITGGPGGYGVVFQITP